MKDFANRFYDLDQFLGGYFHQEWASVLEWQGHEPSFEEAVRFFKSSASSDELVVTTDQLRQFLAMPLSEMELRKALREFGVSYRPQYSGMDYRQWLKAILSILEDPSQNTSYLRYVESTDTGGWKEYVDEETKQMLNIK